MEDEIVKKQAIVSASAIHAGCGNPAVAALFRHPPVVLRFSQCLDHLFRRSFTSGEALPPETILRNHKPASRSLMAMWSACSRFDSFKYSEVAPKSARRDPENCSRAFPSSPGRTRVDRLCNVFTLDRRKRIVGRKELHEVFGISVQCGMTDGRQQRRSELVRANQVAHVQQSLEGTVAMFKLW